MSNKKQLESFLTLANSILKRLDAYLPPELEEPNWDAIAYRWQRIGNKGMLQSLPNPHTFPLSRLKSIDRQMGQLIRNTKQFIEGRRANNVLLTGARGTGKSSLVKALLHEYHKKGLRLIETDKSDLLELSYLLRILQDRPEKFILFCDELSFGDGDCSFKTLKTVLDGRLSIEVENVLIYATSNRRHLMSESIADNDIIINDKGEIHAQEKVEETLSLSDRFGLWLHFYPFSQDDYLDAVASWLDAANMVFDDNTKKAALQWAGARGNRSGRIAWQFVCDWSGRMIEERNTL